MSSQPIELERVKGLLLVEIAEKCRATVLTANRKGSRFVILANARSHEHAQPETAWLGGKPPASDR